MIREVYLGSGSLEITAVRTTHLTVVMLSAWDDCHLCSLYPELLWNREKSKSVITLPKLPHGPWLYANSIYPTLPSKFSPDFTPASILGSGIATGSWRHSHTVFVAMSAGGSHSKAICDLACSFSHVILSPFDFWLSWCSGFQLVELLCL